eukprot:s2025_g23.t1
METSSAHFVCSPPPLAVIVCGATQASCEVAGSRTERWSPSSQPKPQKTKSMQETKLGSKKGCITALSLLYDEDGIQWCVDEELLSVDS